MSGIVRLGWAHWYSSLDDWTRVSLVDFPESSHREVSGYGMTCPSFLRRVEISFGLYLMLQLYLLFGNI